MPAMRIILGIGNPGREYAGTRHNCGFLVVDALAQRHGLTAWRKDWNADVCEWAVPPALGGGKALLLKPRCYVNLSGGVAQAALAFYKLPISDLLVVVDDLNLAFGHLRLRPDGSAGGHNGLRDVEAKLGPLYPRLRMGIGRPRPGQDQVGFVLGGFAPDEQADAQAMVAKAADCVEGWLRDGLAVSCRFNGPLRPEVPAPRPAPVSKPMKSAEQPPTGDERGERID